MFELLVPVSLRAGQPSLPSSLAARAGVSVQAQPPTARQLPPHTATVLKSAAHRLHALLSCVHATQIPLRPMGTVEATSYSVVIIAALGLAGGAAVRAPGQAGVTCPSI